MIYLIVIFNLFQQSEGVAPKGYTDLASCEATLAQMQFEQGFYGRCRSLEDLNRGMPPIRAQTAVPR
jgi:hypothetical protein